MQSGSIRCEILFAQTDPMLWDQLGDVLRHSFPKTNGAPEISRLGDDAALFDFGLLRVGAEFRPRASASKAAQHPHAAHAVVLSDEGRVARDAAWAVTLISAALTRRRDCIGVLWNSVPHLVPAEVYRKGAARMEQGLDPFALWVALATERSLRTLDGRARPLLRSIGLAVFHGHEVEMEVEAGLEPQQRRAISGLLSRIFRTGSPPRDGMVVETARGDRVRVVEEQIGIATRGPVWHLTLDALAQDPPALATRPAPPRPAEPADARAPRTAPAAPHRREAEGLRPQAPGPSPHEVASPAPRAVSAPSPWSGDAPPGGSRGGEPAPSGPAVGNAASLRPSPDSPPLQPAPDRDVPAAVRFEPALPDVGGPVAVPPQSAADRDFAPAAWPAAAFPPVAPPVLLGSAAPADWPAFAPPLVTPPPAPPGPQPGSRALPVSGPQPMPTGSAAETRPLQAAQDGVALRPHAAVLLFSRSAPPEAAVATAVIRRHARRVGAAPVLDDADTDRITVDWGAMRALGPQQTLVRLTGWPLPPALSEAVAQDGAEVLAADPGLLATALPVLVEEVIDAAHPRGTDDRSGVMGATLVAHVAAALMTLPGARAVIWPASRVLMPREAALAAFRGMGSGLPIRLLVAQRRLTGPGGEPVYLSRGFATLGEPEVMMRFGALDRPRLAAVFDALVRGVFLRSLSRRGDRHVNAVDGAEFTLNESLTADGRHSLLIADLVKDPRGASMLPRLFGWREGGAD